MIHKIKIIILSDIFMKKVIAYSILVLIMFIANKFIMLFLLTFIFAYLIFAFWKYISCKLKNIFINTKYNKISKKIFWTNAVVSYIYLLIIAWIIFFISHIVPILTTELNSLSKHIPIVSNYIQDITKNLSHIKNTNELVSSDIKKLMTDKNMWILSTTIEHIKKIWWWLITLLLAYILSFFFIIDRKKLQKYLEWIKKSSLSFLYEEYSFLFSRISKGFLLIFKAQSKIAIANSIFTFLWLLVISFIIWEHIPYMWTLITIVFFLSFVPILWTFISSVPIILIVYNLVWILWVIYVVTMIICIHMLEAYILNPRFISEAVELPVSLTFVILILWEHIFWPIWLIIAVPMFYSLIEIFWDLDKKIRKKLK